ncbi:unnamed protein product [Linum trigynum]|uniref:Secreted protein n=1 Tax=Linum trigynum TaxID=586398 RepID=A0AAV2EGQ1_9ROSI
MFTFGNSVLTNILVQTAALLSLDPVQVTICCCPRIEVVVDLFAAHCGGSLFLWLGFPKELCFELLSLLHRPVSSSHGMTSPFHVPSLTVL